MRKPNPSATFGAPMSLMWTMAPKVPIMVASRCCVYLLHTCTNLSFFEAVRHKHVTLLRICTYSIWRKTNKH
jgi:hypothetical protein